jgi:hypothetical protein
VLAIMTEAVLDGKTELEKQGFKPDYDMDWATLSKQFKTFYVNQVDEERPDQNYFHYDLSGTDSRSRRISFTHYNSSPEVFYEISDFYLSEDGTVIIIPRREHTAILKNMDLDTNGATLSIGGDDGKLKVIVTLYPRHSLYAD